MPLQSSSYLSPFLLSTRSKNRTFYHLSSSSVQEQKFDPLPYSSTCHNITFSEELTIFSPLLELLGLVPGWARVPSSGTHLKTQLLDLISSVYGDLLPDELVGRWLAGDQKVRRSAKLLLGLEGRVRCATLPSVGNDKPASASKMAGCPLPSALCLLTWERKSKAYIK